MDLLAIIQVIGFVFQMILVPVDLNRAMRLYFGCCESVRRSFLGDRKSPESIWFCPGQLTDQSLTGPHDALDDLEMNIIRNPVVLASGSAGEDEYFQYTSAAPKYPDHACPQWPESVYHRCPSDVLSRRGTWS